MTKRAVAGGKDAPARAPKSLSRAAALPIMLKAFEGVVEQMSEHIVRTCRSFVLFNRDIASALHDRHGSVIASGSLDIAGHLATMHHTCKAVIAAFAGDMHSGDVFIVNDPYLGCTHFNDIKIVRPIFHAGEIIAFAQTSAHWPDIGGNVPGSFDANATTHFSEGLRIPPVRLWSAGTFQADVARMIIANTRIPEESAADLHAQASATGVGEQELLRLVARYGAESVVGGCDIVQDYVEGVVRRQLAAMPDGVWERVDYVDQDQGNKGDKLVAIKVKLTKTGDKLFFDLSGSAPPVATNINCGFGMTYSALVMGAKMFFPDVPFNGGFFRVIDHYAPPGTVVNATWPIACAGGLMVFEKIRSAVMSIWSELDPVQSMACSYNMDYFQFGGIDRRNGQSFLVYDWLSGGWGASSGKDGRTYCTIDAVALQTQPVEGQERLAPILVEEHELIRDSGGPGQSRGGLGVRKTIRFVDAEAAVMSYTCDRARAVVWGDRGGLPSIPQTALRDHQGEVTDLGPNFGGVPIIDGDRLSRNSAGGGGNGDPLLREPALVLEDVIDDYVSIERARIDYGVVIEAVDPELCDYRIDQAATTRERDRQRQDRRRLLATPPEEAAAAYNTGMLDTMDMLRHHGVLLDWGPGTLLPRSTAEYRQLIADRSTAYWAAAPSQHA